MSDKELELNKKILEYEYYRQLLNTYQANYEAARILLTDVENALSSFEALNNEKGEKIELFASIGSGSYIKSTFDKKDKILVNIGAKVFVEYTLQQAIEFLNNKKKKITEALENTAKALEELARIVARLESEISELSEKR